MAKFKIDENLPIDVAEMLKAAGHDAMTILDQSMVGELDPKVASVCKAEGRALVTLDLDFTCVALNHDGPQVRIEHNLA